MSTVHFPNVHVPSLLLDQRYPDATLLDELSPCTRPLRRFHLVSPCNHWNIQPISLQPLRGYNQIKLNPSNWVKLGPSAPRPSETFLNVVGTSAKLPPTHQRRSLRKCPVERSACGLPLFAPATQPLRPYARRRTPSEKVWLYAAEPSLGPPPWPSNASWSNKGETSQRPQPERGPKGPKPGRPPRTRWGKGRCTNFHPLKSWLERYMFCTPHHLEEHNVGRCTSCNLFVMPFARSPQCTDCTGPTVGLPPRDLQKQIWIATSKFIQIHATPYTYVYTIIYIHTHTYTMSIHQ